VLSLGVGGSPGRSGRLGRRAAAGGPRGFALRGVLGGRGLGLGAALALLLLVILLHRALAQRNVQPQLPPVIEQYLMK
jgi:hypothetical protein